MWLVFLSDDVEKFGERVILLLIGGAWLAQAPFKFVHIDHRAPLRKNIAHTSGLLLLPASPVSNPSFAAARAGFSLLGFHKESGIVADVFHAQAETQP
ncbi:MAG TPA: hypothetical protein VHT02_00825 [Methylocella sp.]|nr:hypothetical protein [Methylocella sp.]